MGKGIWKMNNSLLSDRKYLDIIKNAIDDEKVKYAVPVYSQNYLTNTDDTIKFTIPFDLFRNTIFKNKG